MDAAESVNRVLNRDVPALSRALSPVGSRAYFPREIPHQAAEARGTQYNGTIGEITDGFGRPLVHPAVAAALSGLAREDLARALLYSPIAGFEDVRRLWRTWQRRSAPAGAPSSLPLVTSGISHGLSVLADLFCAPGTPVAVTVPMWGNYVHVFEQRGGQMRTAPFYRDGAFDSGALAGSLADLPGEQPAIAVANFPNNPGGYSPTSSERRHLVESLVAVAERRPLVVICDDAYLGLVYEPGVPAESVFWELAGRHPRLIPVKVDGATKEFVLFGARVGFITFALREDSEAAAALESKVKGLVRTSVGSPSALGQVVLLAALSDPHAESHVEAIRLELAGRYRALKAALHSVPGELLAPLPFNSGCFALLELSRAAPDAETLRRHLLERESTGVVAIDERHLRLAFCSVALEAIPELVERVVHGATAGMAAV